jgi:competence protein ComEA
MKLNYNGIKELYNTYRNRINMIIIIIIVLLFSLVSFYIIYKTSNTKEINNISSLSLETNNTISKTQIVNKIFIDIKGNVLNPGVYSLDEGSRVIDVINISGGLTENANTRYINLSKILIDGDVIVIYSNEEIEKAKESNIIYIETPCICEEINDACLDNNISNNNSLININTASLGELDSLSGIGESKAQAIIKYREENGAFNSIEDILNVSGISETIFSKIKDFITV